MVGISSSSRSPSHINIAFIALALAGASAFAIVAKDAVPNLTTKEKQSAGKRKGDTALGAQRGQRSGGQGSAYQLPPVSKGAGSASPEDKLPRGGGAKGIGAHYKQVGKLPPIHTKPLPDMRHQRPGHTASASRGSAFPAIASHRPQQQQPGVDGPQQPQQPRLGGGQGPGLAQPQAGVTTPFQFNQRVNPLGRAPKSPQLPMQPAIAQPAVGIKSPVLPTHLDQPAEKLDAVQTVNLNPAMSKRVQLKPQTPPLNATLNLTNMRTETKEFKAEGGKERRPILDGARAVVHALSNFMQLFQHKDEEGTVEKLSAATKTAAVVGEPMKAPPVQSANKLEAKELASKKLDIQTVNANPPLSKRARLDTKTTDPKNMTLNLANMRTETKQMVSEGGKELHPILDGAKAVAHALSDFMQLVIPFQHKDEEGTVEKLSAATKTKAVVPSALQQVGSPYDNRKLFDLVDDRKLFDLVDDSVVDTKGVKLPPEELAGKRLATTVAPVKLPPEELASKKLDIQTVSANPPMSKRVKLNPPTTTINERLNLTNMKTEQKTLVGDSGDRAPILDSAQEIADAFQELVRPIKEQKEREQWEQKDAQVAWEYMNTPLNIPQQVGVGKDTTLKTLTKDDPLADPGVTKFASTTDDVLRSLETFVMPKAETVDLEPSAAEGAPVGNKPGVKGKAKAPEAAEPWGAAALTAMDKKHAKHLKKAAPPTEADIDALLADLPPVEAVVKGEASLTLEEEVKALLAGVSPAPAVAPTLEERIKTMRSQLPAKATAPAEKDVLVGAPKSKEAIKAAGPLAVEAATTLDVPSAAAPAKTVGKPAAAPTTPAKGAGKAEAVQKRIEAQKKLAEEKHLRYLVATYMIALSGYALENRNDYAGAEKLDKQRTALDNADYQAIEAKAATLANSALVKRLMQEKLNIDDISTYPREKILAEASKLLKNAVEEKKQRKEALYAHARKHAGYAKDVDIIKDEAIDAAEQAAAFTKLSEAYERGNEVLVEDLEAYETRLAAAGSNNEAIQKILSEAEVKLGKVLTPEDGKVLAYALFLQLQAKNLQVADIEKLKGRIVQHNGENVFLYERAKNKNVAFGELTEIKGVSMIPLSPKAMEDLEKQGIRIGEKVLVAVKLGEKNKLGEQNDEAFAIARPAKGKDVWQDFPDDATLKQALAYKTPTAVEDLMGELETVTKTNTQPADDFEALMANLSAGGAPAVIPISDEDAAFAAMMAALEVGGGAQPQAGTEVPSDDDINALLGIASGAPAGGSSPPEMKTTSKPKKAKVVAATPAEPAPRKSNKKKMSLPVASRKDKDV